MSTIAIPAKNAVSTNYIKENNPSLYEFFLDYWKYIKGYWTVYNEEDWWNCLIADTDYYVTKYSWSNFCVELLMAFFERCKNTQKPGEPITDAQVFLREWWRYVNKYYKRGNENEEWWNEFFGETKELTEKYKNNPYYCSLVDEFVKVRVKD